MGRRTFAYLRELESSQWWTPDRLRDLQARKLRRLLSTAVRHCPYYNRLFEALGVRAAADDPFDELAKLPLLDKLTIRRNLSGMTNHRVPGGPLRFNTGGSTGEPLLFYVDRRRIGYDKAARMMTHAWFGARPGEPEVYLWGSPIELSGQDRVKRLRDRLTNETLLEAFRLSPESMRQYVARINAIDPVSVFGYPSSLTTLAEFGESEDLRFTGRRLRAVFVTGELLDAHHRRTLKRFFRVPVANGYGSRDGGFIAHECPEGGLHVMDPNVIMEIVSGEIVITHLDALAMPLLRYRTGDMGALLDEACPCGRGLRTMGMVEGRRTDHLVGCDGTLKHALAGIYVLREMMSVSAFRIHQRADHSVDVYVVPAPGFGQRDRQRIISGLSSQLGRGAEVRVHSVDSIGTSRSGKFRQVISEAVETSRPTVKAGEPPGVDKPPGKVPAEPVLV